MAQSLPVDEEFKYKIQSETTGTTQSYEDIMKELIEEGIRIERPRVPKLIRDLQEAIDDTLTRGSGIIWHLRRSMDLRTLPILSEALLKAKRCIVRTRAASAIAYIEEYNEDTTALASLRKALNDSCTDAKFHAALALVYLGDRTNPIRVLGTLTRGENMEKWSIDWNGYMGVENMTEEELGKEKADFKQKICSRAKEALAIINTPEAISILKKIADEGDKESKDLLSNLPIKSIEHKPSLH